MAITNIVRVSRGQLFDVTEAGKLLGLSGSLIRMWIGMQLLHAVTVGNTWAVKAEDLADASRRYHVGYLIDAPRLRDGTPINVVELV